MDEIERIMRYYFHLESETTVFLDHLGKEFAGEDSAARHAASMARDLAADDQWLGWFVQVIDANNTQVLSVQIVDALLHG
ncbi:MAG: hypothetical protein AB7S70_09520 [Hyphomicrobium sp.]|uniref:DUF6894 family protein n=1 Tax=Hyphomicrobium sp. TaxID=82 RepID=UPI003D104E4C